MSVKDATVLASAFESVPDFTKALGDILKAMQERLHGSITLNYKDGKLTHWTVLTTKRPS